MHTLTYKQVCRTAIVALLLMWPVGLYAQTERYGTLFDADHLLAYAVAGMLLFTFLLLFCNRLFVYREREENTGGLSQNARLALVLRSSNLRLWLYEPATRHYTILSESGIAIAEYNPVEFSRLYDRDDFEVLRSAVFDICDGKRLSATVSIRGFREDNGLQRHYEINASIVSRTVKGRVKRVLGIQRDVTDNYLKKQKVSQLLARFQTVFSSSLMDMIYYDADGVLRDINDKACQTFHVVDRSQVTKGNFLLKNSPIFSHFDYEHLQNTRTTCIVNFDDFKSAEYQLELTELHGIMYYESTINPIRNADGKLQGIYMAGRDVTEMVESFHRQQERTQRLHDAIRSIEQYINNINYALRVTDVRLVNYYPSSYTLELSDNISKTQLHMSQLRCIRLATPPFRRKVSSALNRMDHLTRYPVVETIETEIRDKKGRQIWLMFNMIPIIDAEGHVERYFGMCRNMTDMVETEHRLAVETKKAQETELLKQSFLTNMSYEIRTPLNAVVGFAELFESDHDVEDEPLFVEEIKKNSNTLLQLVNDILFVSRLDANMIEYSKSDVDFAQLFDGFCQMGWTVVKPNVKTVVENPYASLVLNIDQTQVGKVIQILCGLGAHSTEEGVVRAKYDYRMGELIIGIEDTGNGIDAETLPHVFDRFVRNGSQLMCGSGLDLPIVQLLVQQMGGNIEVESEYGKGTSFWITIPCEAKSMEKNRDIVVPPSEPPLFL